jgi:lactoylglutathione lyase
MTAFSKAGSPLGPIVRGMRVAATILYVPDVAAALAFYERAFGLEAGFVAPDGSYATLGGQGAVLAFAKTAMAPDAEGAVGAPAGFEVWIEAEDVPAALARAVAAGAEPVQEPVVKPWGQTVAYVRDPNGTLIELGSPVAG